MRYPAAFQVRSWRAYVSPLSVDSNAKSALAVARRLISSMTRRPAASAANRGSSGDNPWAIRSALTNWIKRATFGRYSRAKVALPAPLGPAITMHRGRVRCCMERLQDTLRFAAGGCDHDQSRVLQGLRHPRPRSG